MTGDVTLAVFDSAAVRDAATATVTVTDVEAPEAKVPRFQVTVPPDSVPPPVAETNDVPAGTTSVRVTPVAEEGPAFATSRV